MPTDVDPEWAKQKSDAAEAARKEASRHNKYALYFRPIYLGLLFTTEDGRYIVESVTRFTVNGHLLELHWWPEQRPSWVALAPHCSTGYHYEKN